MEPLVTVRRGDFIESIHFGSIAIVDSAGRLLAFAGDPSLRTFIRSSAKPFQAVPRAQEGGIEEFALSGEELALVCSSHGGEPIHVGGAAALLRKGDFDEEDLLCGVHQPYDERVASEMRQAGETPTPLHNNCSGNHAGMLLSTRLLDLPSSRYVDSEHPLQMRNLQVLADFAGIDPGEIGVAVDGCGAPSYHLSLYRAAFAYARLAAAARAEAPAPVLPRYTEPAREIFDAMTAHPDFVAGNWSISTPLMEAQRGRLIAKEGAEGFYAMALDPSLAGPVLERAGVSEGEALGIALKIADGSMSRGRDPVIIRILEVLGIPIDTPRLAPYREPAIVNCAGEPIGRAQADFDLHLL